MRFQRLISFGCLLIIVACGQPKKQELASTVSSNSAVNTPDSVAEGPPTELPPAAMAGSPEILFTGTFHGDEVSEGVADQNWFGLFTDDSKEIPVFVLRKTKIIAERVTDGLVDNDDEKTGWEISTENGEYPVVLIRGMDLTERLVPAPSEIPGVISPGDTVAFIFLGEAYSMFATGYQETDSVSGTQRTGDYTLYISRTRDDVTITDKLVSHQSFDDAMTSIIWAGDIDGDNRLDLIINRSNHYNVSAPALFLSGHAGDKKVVIFVAEHVSVGC